MGLLYDGSGFSATAVYDSPFHLISVGGANRNQLDQLTDADSMTDGQPSTPETRPAVAIMTRRPLQGVICPS